MPDFHFADGFDVSEPLALGLTPAQLVVGVVGLLIDYADLGSGLPRVLAVPVAVVVAALGLTLAVGRRDGRPLVEWAGVALRFAARPKRGRFDTEESVITAAIAMPQPRSFIPTPPAVADVGASARVETDRRSPLVLLPIAVHGPLPDNGSGEVEIDDVNAPSSPADPEEVATASLEVADALVAEPLVGAARFAPAAVVATPPSPVATALPAAATTAEAASAQATATLTATAPPRIVTPPGPPVFVGATRRLTFFSLSGGVGRTTLAVETAALLSGRGWHRDPVSGSYRPLRVALLDLDGRSPCVGLRLGIGQPSVCDWLLDGASAARLDQHLVRHRSGLRALLGSIPASGPTPAPEQVGDVVETLERQGAHFVVCDIAAGLGAVNEWVLQNVHDIFVTITPTTRGLQDAYRSTEVLRRMGLRHKLHYVVNRSRGAVDLTETMGDLGGRIDAEIDEDAAVGIAENQHLLLGLDGDGAAADGFRKLAAAIYPAIGDGAPVGPMSPRVAEPGWRRFTLGRRRRAG